MTLANYQMGKRRYPRLPVNIKINGHWWGPKGDEHPLVARLTVISEGGVQLQCADIILVNSALEFTLHLGTMNKVEVRAVVRWWRRNGQIRDIGAQFVEPVKPIGVYVERQMYRIGK